MKDDARHFKPKRGVIDFHAVEPKHAEIHARLENWALWLHGTGGGSSASPMFRLYRPDQHWERSNTTTPVDGTDAQRIAKEMAGMPELHRSALTWSYVVKCGPAKARAKLGLTYAGLALCVRDGRQMLMNRLA